MLTAIFVTALVASALGSPSVDLSRSEALSGRAAAPYTVQVLRGGWYAAPAALIGDQFVICSASLLAGAKASDLKVSTGGWFAGKTAVTDVLVHPDAALGADVAVLKLAKPIAKKGLAAVPGVVSVPTPAGSLAVVSGWGWLGILSTSEQWLVLPRYCGVPPQAAASLCAAGSFQAGAPLAVDGLLAGLASAPGKGPVKGVVSYVDLADPSVQKFIAAATGTETGSPPRPPRSNPPRPPPPSPSPAARVSTRPDGVVLQVGTASAIHVNGGLPTKEPLVLKDGLNGGELAFHEPDSGDAVVLAAGERVRLVCAGKGNGFTNFKSSQDLTAECVEDDAFLVNGQSVQVHQLGCKAEASNSARKVGTCGDNGQFTQIRIGFEVGDDFVTQIENCFDSRTFDAVYSRAHLTPAIAGHESGVQRPKNFQPTFYENLVPNTLYIRKNQRSAIAQLLGSAELAQKYIGDDSTHFLARGHLSAKADHIQGPQQRATFYYINVAPQWQTFNGDNWEKLESSVRDWVVSSGRSVHVVTGTWGTATLPDKDGKETELYLQADKQYIRVPKYYWKVVYDPATKQAAAFVGLNNPYHETQPADVLCEDVCARYNWLSWKASNQQSGYGFCCDVNELRKIVTTIPADIEAESLL
ncbi:hypothetical protein ONE63_009292 [Megalurothrips usitatus]|uniref:DNA/RNA non-specific endonuclease domain-containing protein n=1 Tax=Megalurothrips usitatus TaxID=439358 RepID=A0AAV7XNB7_9NEOP|nr:hypothetical protein ONE63_009292 [Megalurothrips usitatus]